VIESTWCIINKSEYFIFFRNSYENITWYANCAVIISVIFFYKTGQTNIRANNRGFVLIHYLRWLFVLHIISTLLIFWSKRTWRRAGTFRYLYNIVNIYNIDCRYLCLVCCDLDFYKQARRFLFYIHDATKLGKFDI